MAIAEELKVIVTVQTGDAINQLKQVKKAGVDLEQFGKQMAKSGRQLSLAITTPLVLIGRQVLKYAKEQEEYKDTFDKFSTAFQEIGKVAADIMIPVLDKIADVIKSIAEWFTNLDPGLQKAIMLFLALAAAIGPLLAMIGPLISGIGTLIGIFTGVNTALSLLSMGGGPLSLILIAIAALAAAAILIIQNWGPISEFFTKLWNTVKDAVVGTWEKVKTFVIETSQKIFEWLKENWPTILAILTGPIGLAVLAIVKNWDAIKGAFQSAFNFIKDIVLGIRDWINQMVAFITEPVKKVVDFFEGAFAKLKDKLVGHSIIPDMVDAIEEEMGRLGPIFEKNFNTALDSLENLQAGLQPFTDALGEMVLNADEGWKSFKQAAKDAIVAVINMLAKMAFVKAAEAFASLNIPQGVAYTAAGTAALVAAGVVKALGEGGLVMKPTMALVGEKGPEAVIPLNRAGGALGNNFTIIVNGSVMEEEGLARKLGGIIARQRRGY